MQERRSHRVENRFEYPDGHTVWFDLSIQPSPEGIFVLSADITDRKVAEVVLQKSEERFRGAFERTYVAMVLTDIDNRFLRVNETFAAMFGYSEAELLTMGLADLAESYAQRRELVARGTSYFEMEKRYLHKDGRVLWGRTNVSLVRDADGRTLHYVGQVQDITLRKAAEEALQQSESRFRTMANSIPQLAWMAHADGYIYWYNQRWYDYTGTTPEQMQGWG